MKHVLTPQRRIGPTTVQPGEFTILEVGVYENGMPQPKLNIKLGPHPGDTISTAVFQLPNRDTYALMVAVQSYYEHPVKIEVEAE